jgi:ankyrin repeat protein
LQTLLRLEKADIDHQNSVGDTALHISARQGYTDAVLVLLKKARLDVKNNMGETGE